MKNLLIILSFCVSSITIAQDEMFATEGCGTFQNNPASFGNQEEWSVNTFGQIGFTDYYGVNGSYNINGGGQIKLKKESKHHLILGGSSTFVNSYFINQQTSRISLGYRLQWNENASAAIAIGPGISDLTYNLYKPMVSSGGTELYFTEKNHGRNFDLSVGAMFNWKTLYGGVSATHINRPSVGVVPRELAPSYNVQAGYKIQLKESAIFPVTQFLYVGGFSSYQIMTNYIFKNDLFSFGLGYRSGGSVLVGVSAELVGIRLGYNYSTNGNTYSEYSGEGTHELRLSYRVKSK